MDMDTWEPTLTAGPLLGIAAAAIALILVMVIYFRIHAFVTLVIVSVLTAIAAQIPLAGVPQTLAEGFGSTLSSVALLVGLGAMIGRLVEYSGGAKSLAEALVSRFGENKAPLALGVASLIMGFPIFFDAGLSHASGNFCGSTAVKWANADVWYACCRCFLSDAYLSATASWPSRC